MKAIGSRPKVHVTADGSGVVGHAGARLLADLADTTGLTAAYATVLGPLRPRGTGHDPGRVATDLAVMIADGGETITDLAVLRDQAGVFGPVASTATAWRLLAQIDDTVLASLRSARARAREIAWLQAAEKGEDIPAVRAGGCEVPGLVLDIDATLVTCHSEKESAAPTYKGGFGYHPLLCFLANTGGALAGRLRPGNAGANTATDHITVLDDALAQLPDAHRYGTDILIRTDSAGCSPPNRSVCATGSCTSPPASPEAAVNTTCESPRPGPGDTNWPWPSTGSPPCPDPPAEHRVPAAHDLKGLGDPGHRVGPSACSAHKTGPGTHKLTLNTVIPLEPKERG